MIILNLVQNIALLMALAMMHQVVPKREKGGWFWSHPLVPLVLSGLAFGGFGIVGMMTPLRFSPGVIFDGRSIILAVAGMFGGPLVAAVAAALCGTYRLWLGGGGVLMGVSVICEAAALGAVFHWLRKRNPCVTDYLPLWGFGLLVHVVMVGFMLLLPAETRWEVMRSIGPPVLMLYPVATMIVCRLFVDQENRAKNETALLESEAKYRELVESVNSIILRMDKEGNITFFNEFALRFFGYRPEEILGRNVVGTIVPETDSAGRDLRAMIADICGHPERYTVNENENMLRDRTRVWIAWTNKPLAGPGGQFVEVLSVGSDVTRQKQAAAEKARLEAQLQQAQKMESVGRLAGGVAHDFNNMLGVILGITDMALDEVPPDQPLHDDLREIQKAAERSADLTRQLLAFARRQTVAPEVLDLNETVGGMLKMLKRLIGEDLQLDWHPGADLWPVWVDPSQVDQILANLCVNARDAIAGVGRITIGTENRRVEAHHFVGHADFTPGEYVLLTVKDDGCGMDGETLGHIFEPFFTTKEVGKGTGLGLATIYGIVRQNHGFIDVRSEMGQGTTFGVYLPRHAGEIGQKARGEGGSGPVTRGRETILLVEDEPALLRTTATMLERLGYAVLTADSPAEALRLARQHHGDIRLLMTDVVMPEMNGRDLAGNLLPLYPQMRRLFMSGYTADIIAHQGVLDEGTPFIQKPFSSKDLAASVRKVLDEDQTR